MTLRIDIEAESYAELLNKVIYHLHLPCDIGVHVELRDKSTPVSALSAARSGPEVAEVVPPTNSAPPAGEDAASDSETVEAPQRRKRRTKAEMEAARRASSPATAGEATRAEEAAKIAHENQQTLPPTLIEQAIAEKTAAAQSATSMSIFDDEPTPPPAAPLPTLTSDEFRKKLQDFAAREGGGGVNDVVKVLDKFGYSSIKMAKPEKYAEIVAEVDAIFAKKAA